MYQRVLITIDDLNQNDSPREGMKHGAPQRSILGPLLFLLYINDLPRTIKPYQYCLQIILVTSPNKNDFQINIYATLNCINEWLNVNLLYKTSILFITNNKPKTNIKIAYD